MLGCLNIVCIDIGMLNMVFIWGSIFSISSEWLFVRKKLLFMLVILLGSIFCYSVSRLCLVLLLGGRVVVVCVMGVEVVLLSVSVL